MSDKSNLIYHTMLGLIVVVIISACHKIVTAVGVGFIGVAYIILFLKKEPPTLTLWDLTLDSLYRVGGKTAEGFALLQPVFDKKGRMKAESNSYLIVDIGKLILENEQHFLPRFVVFSLDDQSGPSIQRFNQMPESWPPVGTITQPV